MAALWLLPVSSINLNCLSLQGGWQLGQAGYRGEETLGGNDLSGITIPQTPRASEGTARDQQASNRKS